MEWARVGVPAALVLVGLLMASTIVYTVTGLLPWLVANLLAGVAAIVAGAMWNRTPRKARLVALYATALYAPFNFFLGVMNLVGGGYDPVPVTMVAIPLAVVAAFVWTWSRPEGRMDAVA